MAQEVAEPGLGPELAEPGIRAVSPTRLALKRLLRKRIALVSIVVILIFYGAGTLAPLLTTAGIIPPYTQQNLKQSLKSPNWYPIVRSMWSQAKAGHPVGLAKATSHLFERKAWHHPFGTDILGRDQLSRCIWAAQTTVIVTVATLITGGLILSVGLGLLSGYAGGWIDTLIMRVGDIFISLPGLLMLILINAALKTQVRALAADVEDFTGINGLVRSGAPDYLLIFGALSLFSWVGGARVIRSQVLALRETEFVLAARSLGASTRHILLQHLLPNVSNIIIVSMSLGLAGIAGSEIVLTWFGVGIQPPRPSYGALIFDASGVRTINAHLYLLAFPGGIVAGLFFAFNLLGDALTDVFTPRSR